MKSVKLVFLIISLSFTAPSYAEEEKKNKLQIVMQNLLQDTQDIVRGMMLEDYTIIFEAADRIASHPTPGLGIQVKLMRNMGGELPAFKALDGFVHDRAVSIRKASRAKDMHLVTREYNKLLNGCQSCHTQFKTRVSNILSK